MRERETGIVIAFLKAAIEQKPFQIEKQEIEWEIVEKILKFHRVINMAYYGYLQLENKECVPKQFVENMKKVNEKLTAKEACQHFGLEEIREKFEQERIAFLPLKGCILKYYYPAPQMRYMGDLDILYKEEQKDVLHQCLGELGYQFLSSDEVHDAYGKKPFLHIEMHCKLFGKQEKQKKYFEHIWEYVHLADGKQFEYEMTQEDYYLFLLAHMEKHFLQGGTGLRSLTDFHVFHQKKGNELNRQIVKMRLEEMELDRFEAFLFELDACVFGESEWSDVELMQTFDYMLLWNLRSAEFMGCQSGFEEKGS